LKLLVKGNKRRAVSPVIATLLLIAIAVAAAIIVYAFVTGLIGGLTTGSSSNLVPATASLTIPSGSGAGTLVISVSNNANSPITGIQITYNGMEDSAGFAATCMGQLPGALNNACSGVAAPAGTDTSAMCGETQASANHLSVPFCNTVAGVATIIGTANGLPVGSQTSASDAVQALAGNLQSGTTYSFTLTVNFANGGTHTEALSATAQL